MGKGGDADTEGCLCYYSYYYYYYNQGANLVWEKRKLLMAKLIKEERLTHDADAPRKRVCMRLVSGTNLIPLHTNGMVT